MPLRLKKDTITRWMMDHLAEQRHRTFVSAEGGV